MHLELKLPPPHFTGTSKKPQCHVATTGDKDHAFGLLNTVIPRNAVGPAH